MITADDCVNFVDAWQDDLEDWQRFSSRVNNVGSTRDAMDFLQLNTWTRAEFGAACGGIQERVRCSEVSRFANFSAQPRLELPKGWQELAVAGWLEAERPVGVICGVIVF